MKQSLMHYMKKLGTKDIDFEIRRYEEKRQIKVFINLKDRQKTKKLFTDLYKAHELPIYNEQK